MFAVNTYEEIVRNEERLGQRHIVVLLFVRPSLPGAREVIAEFNYLHYNSRQYCSIYAVGYSNAPGAGDWEDLREAGSVSGGTWYYSDQAFIACKAQLEARLKWVYSGEKELLILQSNPAGPRTLNFQNYVAINVDYGLREAYIDSFPRLMESLVRSARTEVETAAVVRDLRTSRLRVGRLAGEAVAACKRVPLPLRRVLADRLFYRTAGFYR